MQKIIVMKRGRAVLVEYHLCIKCCRMIDILTEAHVIHSGAGSIFYNHRVCPENEKTQYNEPRVR